MPALSADAAPAAPLVARGNSLNGRTTSVAKPAVPFPPLYRALPGASAAPARAAPALQLPGGARPAMASEAHDAPVDAPRRRLTVEEASRVKLKLSRLHKLRRLLSRPPSGVEPGGVAALEVLAAAALQRGGARART